MSDYQIWDVNGPGEEKFTLDPMAMHHLMQHLIDQKIRELSDTDMAAEESVYWVGYFAALHDVRKLGRLMAEDVRDESEAAS